MGGTTGNYSNIIVYDENKRYYYLNPQKNKPLLDDELRNMHIAVMDQLRRSVQHTQGDVAVPLKKYSTSTPSTDHFRLSVDAGMVGGQDNNFVVKGGNSTDNPAVLFAKGYYIFLSGDITYKDQMYGSSVIDIDTETNKSKTLTSIPDLITPSVDRRDVVYIDLHFAQVTATTGIDDEIYYDSGILDPRVGTSTANRLRAVIDIRVHEGWEGEVSKGIFDSPYFLGSYDDSIPPTEQHFKIPIAVIYREASITGIQQNNIVDLLTMYDKRVMTLEELSYRSRHGGYGETAVFEKEGAFTGFHAQFPNAKIDEGALATGLNQGFGAEALNSNAVTPRVLDNTGKFMMGALQVGSETGTQTYPVTAETGPAELHPGEFIAHEGSMQHLAIGYDRGVTGVREYSDALSIHLQGLTGVSINLLSRGVTGVAGFSMHNLSGETGTYAQFIESENYSVIDFKGRLGYNTATPGWDALPTMWNITRYPDPVNIVVDINDSQRIRNHLFVDQDTYTQGDVFGKTWTIPSIIDKENKAYFGFTGVPTYGITGSSAVVVVKPGIATQGLSGIEDYRGYTGIAGFYESYDKDGGRIFTIGDLGPEYDRVVRALYGTGLVPLYTSNTSFKYLKVSFSQPSIYDTVPEDPNEVDLEGPNANEWELQAGDIVTASIDFLVGDVVDIGPITVVGDTYAAAIENLRSQLETALQAVNGSIDITVHILTDDYDESLPLEERAQYKNEGRLIIRDKLSELSNVQTNTTFKVTRGSQYKRILWTDSKYYGSGSYGGDLLDFKFAKLDLGEAADAWLFNGDVFFNGIGRLNRVTFSPNVIFRDDVFVYGDLYANNVNLDRAVLSYLTINQKLDSLRFTNLGSGFDDTNAPVGGLTVGVGPSGDVDLFNMQRNQYKSLWLYINGDAKAENFIADLCGVTGNVVTVVGNSFPRANDTMRQVYFNLGGSTTDTTKPYGMHLVDARSGVNVLLNQGYSTFRMDYGDGRGNYGLLNVDLRGNLVVSNNLASRRVTAGTTTANSAYDLYVANSARIEGTLEVSNIKFIGTGAAEGSTEISEPQNVVIYRNGIKTVDNKPNGILRTKEICLDQKVVLVNSPLDYNDSDVIADISDSVSQDQARIAHIQTGALSNREPSSIPVWVKDTLTYASPAFTEYGVDSLDSDLVSAQIDRTSENFRYNFQRVTLATLGTVKMTYIGRVIKNAIGTNDIVDFVQKYEFVTPYFKDRNKGNTVDWFADSQTTTSNNFIATLDLSLIDDRKSFYSKIPGQVGPQIYNTDRPIWVYIPLESWTHYRVSDGTSFNSPDYYTIYLAQRWNHRLQQQNSVEMLKLNEDHVSTSLQRDWLVSVFPRFKRITKSTVGVTEDLYVAEWDLDLVVYPDGDGTTSDLHGRMFIGYYD
jgi:hypothetical protein